MNIEILRPDNMLPTWDIGVKEGTLEITGDEDKLDTLEKDVQGYMLSWDAAKWFASRDENDLGFLYKKPYTKIALYIDEKMENNELVYCDKFIKDANVFFEEFSFSAICPPPFAIFAKRYSNEGVRWKRDNWGTTSDGFYSKRTRPNRNKLIYEFSTYESAPILLLIKLHQKHNDLEFKFSLEHMPETVLYFKQNKIQKLISDNQELNPFYFELYELKLEPVWERLK